MSSVVEPEASGDSILCNYFIAFVDLLGQSERLLEFKHADQIQPDSPQYRKWLKGTFGAVKQFREAFLNFLQSFNTPREGSLVPAQFTSTDVRIIPASDSLVIYTSLYDHDGSRSVKSINSVVAILQALGALAPMFIALGKPFRAGVAIGLGMEAEGVGLYGPCLPLAFELEKEADYPRILIDPYVLEFLKAFSDEEDDSVSTRFLVAQARDANSMIFRDRDGKLALDFLGAPVLSLYEISASKELDPYIEGYKRIQENIADSKTLKIRSKFLLLKEYYDSRASIWLKNGASL